MRWALVWLGGMAALVPATWLLWGFMVDDALISARYAAHLAAGEGYRFNAGGAVTDGVTPLGWAYLLAPFSGGGVLAGYRAAKVIGVAGWWLSGGALALAIDSLPGRRAKWLGLVLLATSVPLAAWSAAGMETGLCIALAAASASARVLGREAACVGFAAVVAAWRPEALPWAITLALAPPRREGPPYRWAKLGVVVAPAAIVAVLRETIFGHATPLGAIAKPSTLTHGMVYALACALLTGAVALVAFRGLPRWVHGLQAAVLAHLAALALAGGDWMPVSRLATTALPTLALAAAAIASEAPALHSAPRLGLALAGQIFVAVTQGPALAAVEPKRLAVIEEHRAALGRAGVVAALDIGWVGAATPATVVDLAGVTDPDVALLPGGHTSKLIPTWLLDARKVDVLVLHLAPGAAVADPWHDSAFATKVEQRLASMPGVQESFALQAAGEAEPRYLRLERRAVPLPSRAPASETGF